MIVKLWDNSFSYTTDETNGYVMSFTEGDENPNNLVFTDQAYPQICVGQTVGSGQ
jgi:hypothetical protein